MDDVGIFRFSLCKDGLMWAGYQNLYKAYISGNFGTEIYLQNIITFFHFSNTVKKSS